MRNLKKLAVALCFLLASSSAFALGLGGYAQFEGGTGTIEPEVGGDVDVTSSAWGLGLTLDTDPMTAGLWSYRLNLGYQGATFDPDAEGPEGESTDFDGFVVDNTFAFTLMNDKMMRVWAGPVIRLASYMNDENNVETTVGVFGVGAAVGLNYLAAEKFIVSPSLTVGYNWMSGTSNPDVGPDEDFDMTMFTYGLKVDFLYDL